MADLPIPTLEAMRGQFLDDIALAAADAGLDDPPIEEGSDWYALGTACSNLTTIVCENVRLSEADWDPRTCSDARIEEWRATLGLPEVVPTGATGKLIARLVASLSSVTDGTRLTYHGLKYAVVGDWINISDGTEIDGKALDTGEVTDAKGGEKMSWDSTPPGFSAQAEVSKNVPFTGGTDQESAEHKRSRVLNRLANPPAGGNWSQLRETAMNTLSNVSAYVLPALGGPGSCKVVCTKTIDPENRDWSRAPTPAMLTLIRNAIWAQVSSADAIVVQASSAQACSVALEIDIPDDKWANDVPWPQLEVADGGYVAVTAVTSSTSFTVSARTTTAPVSGQTYVDWWSPGDQKFYKRLVTVSSGGTGAWVLTVDQPCVDEDNTSIAIGDYISPAAHNSEAYGDTWRGIMAQLGPGENTSQGYVLNRAYRHPQPSAADNPSLTNAQKRTFMNTHPEVADADYSYRSVSSPSVPGTVNSAPQVLTLDNFGIYKQ